jgi:hypothetical protein
LRQEIVEIIAAVLTSVSPGGTTATIRAAERVSLRSFLDELRDIHIFGN